jgi:hypothetical protein
VIDGYWGIRRDVGLFLIGPPRSGGRCLPAAS